MNRTKSKFFKGFGAIVLTLAMLITMIPVTEAWADTQDITPPVIESISLAQNGRTDLKVGDKLTLTFSGYDQDSEITWVQAWAGDFPEEFKGAPVKGEGNTYTFEETIYSAMYGDWHITSFLVEDSCGNVTEVEVDFRFTVEKVVDSTTKMEIVSGTKEIIFDEENKDGNLNIEATFSDYEKEINYATCYFDVKDEDGYIYSNWCTIGRMNENTSVYGGGLWWEKPIGNCTYTLVEIVVTYADGTAAYLETVPEYVCNIKNNLSDKNAPVITEVTIDKQGEFVDSGDVTFTVKAADESGLNDVVYVYISCPIDIADSYLCVQLNVIEMSEDKKTATYIGSISVDDLYPCEWYINDIGVEDIYGNNMYYFEYANCYFYVNGEGFIEKTYNDVNVYLVDEDGDTLAQYSGTLPRRVKLGDVFGDKWIDALEDSPELGKFLGWTYNGEIVTKDSIILVENDNAYISITPKYEKQKIIAYYWCLHQDGNAYGTETIITDKAITYGELMEMVECPENDMYTFTGWKAYEDDEAYVTDRYVSLYATYDKYPVYINIAYLDADGNLKVVDEKKDFNAGTTYGDVLEAYVTSEENWLVNKDLESEIDITSTYFNAIAQHDDKQIIEYYASWIADSDDSTEYGETEYIESYIVVDKSLAKEDNNHQLEEILLEELELDYFDKLTNPRIEGIDAYDSNWDGYIDQIGLYCEYDNIIVNLYYYDENTENEIDFYYALNAGEGINLPAELNGEKVYWWEESSEEYYTGSFTVPKDAEIGYWYFLYLETELPEDAIIHENATLPSTPTTPSTPSVPEEKPVVEMDKEVVEETTDKIEEAIKEAEKNETATEETKPVQVVVDMKKEDGTVATEVPKEILEAAKGQNVEVVLDMGDYSWTINGNDIKATDLKDINLEVELETSNIPSATVEKLAKGQETHQLSLTHNGDFGFKAELTINVGKDNEGQYGNLYYYDSDGKLVFMNAGKIDENGNVSLSFSHASEYVVVISDKPVVADTSDNTNIALYVCILLAGAGLMVVSLKKRNAF